MKKIILSIFAGLAVAANVSAQEQTCPEKFFPNWQLGLKGGIGVTVGETEQPFKYLLSPATDITVGYNFTPLFTLRADFTSWQGKGVNSISTGLYDYKFSYVQGAIDAVFDFCNMFVPYKPHVVNPYIFVGAGGMVMFNNQADPAKLPTENYYWSGTTGNWVGRVGLGVDFRCSDLIAIELEVTENMTGDKFNSKKGDIFDHQVQALLGLKFSFGVAQKKSAYKAQCAADAAAAAAAAAATAQEAIELANAIAKAKASIANAEKNLASNGEAYGEGYVMAINNGIASANNAINAKEPVAILAAAAALDDAVAKANRNLVVAKQAEAEQAAAVEKAAYETSKAQAAIDAAEAAKDNNNCVFFLIGNSDIRSNQQYKINKVVNALKANPEATVTVCGFADNKTGKPDTNMTLSEDRANDVKDALVAAGIAPDRIRVFFFGDTVQVSKVVEKNRVAVFITK